MIMNVRQSQGRALTNLELHVVQKPPEEAQWAQVGLTAAHTTCMTLLDGSETPALQH